MSTPIPSPRDTSRCSRSDPHSGSLVTNAEAALAEAQARIDKITKYKQKVDPDYTPNILVCAHCSSACEVDAIDFDMKGEEIDLDVGAILVAVGFQRQLDRSRLARAESHYSTLLFLERFHVREVERRFKAGHVAVDRRLTTLPESETGQLVLVEQ